MSEKLWLLAISAGLASIVVALVMPLTQPESIATLATHPVSGTVINASATAARAFARLLAGAPLSDAGGPSIRDFYPNNATTAAASSRSGGAAGAAAPAELDWADPRVWAAQQERIRDPYYTPDEISALLHWCSPNTSAGTGTGRSGGASGNADGGISDGGDGEPEQAEEAAMRFRRLADWVAANGGDASRVALGVDERGVRGLQASQAIAAGEIALAVPLGLGLSIATFRAARAAAGPTSPWRGVEDADLYLDALALAYEVAAHGERSPWADYLCLLPRAFGGLPVHASDPDTAALLSHLPALRRLAARRRAQLSLLAERLAPPALESLPGGRAAMARLRLSGGAAACGGSGGTPQAGCGGVGRRDLWAPLWHWAVAASKTRSVSLGTEDMRSGGGGGAPGEDGLPFRLPLAMLEWLQEVGVMLPLFDLANHAFEGEGANVAYQLLPAPFGSGGLAACLVARTAIAPGQPLRFDYVASAEGETGPACLDRWLLEYGFVPDSADPRRDCDTLHVTPGLLAAALLRARAGAASAPLGPLGPLATADEVAAALQAQMDRLPEGGLPARLEIQVRHPDPGEGDGGQHGQAEHVLQRWAVTHWLAAALAGVEERVGYDEGKGMSAPSPAGVGERGSGLDVDGVLLGLLLERSSELEQLEERALGGCRRGAGRAEKRSDEELSCGVAAVAASGRRAVRRAVQREERRRAESPSTR